MNYFIIGYIISVILAIALCIVVYKNDTKEWIITPTIETLVKDFWIFLLFSFMPITNSILVLWFSVYIIWKESKILNYD